MELTLQIQASAKSAYNVFLNSPEEHYRDASQRLINLLVTEKTQGLWWDQKLEKQTLRFWRSQAEAGGFLSYII